VNFYSFHIGDYASKTRHLSWDEDMAYRRLLDMYYGTEKPLPKDKAVIYRLMMARTPEQKEAVDVVLGEFFEETDAGYRNQRCDEEIASAAAKREKASQSARKRWDNADAEPPQADDDANALPSQSAPNAPNPNPNPNPKLETRKARVQFRELNGFEIFWKLYPRKTGKGAARRAYDVAWKKTDEEGIFAAAERYAASNPDPKFTPHPATWLNQERWLDEELQPKPTPEPFNGTSNGQVFIKQGTDAFDAWIDVWKKKSGKSPPVNQNGGWFFPTEYPEEQDAT
jgi:uncharacterized protein YdaU (DUF1376 family)